MLPCCCAPAAFIDADEFVVLEPGVASLPALLRRYEAYGGLQLHWKVFGPGGHAARPPGGVLTSYRRCCTSRQHTRSSTKSIVQPAYATESISVHHFNYSGGRYAVNTAGLRMEGPRLARPEDQVRCGLCLLCLLRLLAWGADVGLQRRRLSS